MDKLREILENLCHNTMGNPPYRIDQALSQIKEELLGKLPKEKEDYDCLSDITHADKELAETQAIAMRIGFNSCLAQVKKIISEA